MWTLYIGNDVNFTPPAAHYLYSSTFCPQFLLVKFCTPSNASSCEPVRLHVPQLGHSLFWSTTFCILSSTKIIDIRSTQRSISFVTMAWKFEPDEFLEARVLDPNRPPVSFQRWCPPEDPDRPRFPYLPGFSMKVRRHIPPPPFGDSNHHPSARPFLTEEYLSSMTQSQMVVANPPLDTPRPDDQSESDTAQVTIDSPISIGGARGAQVVGCTVVLDGKSGKSFKAAAKIYDALYYSFCHSMVSSPYDTVYQADADYSREAAAYEHLEKAGQTGAFAPKYFGSWTFDMPITSKGVPQTRPVRMVLTELLNGITLRSTLAKNNGDRDAELDSFHYPEGYRLEILAQAMDGFVKQSHSGVLQMDLATRNVMLVQRSQEEGEAVVVDGLPLPRVVLVDYNQAMVFSRSVIGKNPMEDVIYKDPQLPQYVIPTFTSP